MRILVVEDEQALNELLVKQLQAAHYSVDGCLTGSDALDYLLGAEYDAVVLDIMLPGVSGLEVLRRMRAKGDRTPVILLTAKDGIEDRVTGLDAGADDYLVKPFAFDELLARLRVMTRRASASVSDVFTVADLTVDCAARTVSRGGVPVALSSKELPFWNTWCATEALCFRARKSATMCGTMIMRAGRTWWMSISGICAKSWTTAFRKSCCTRCAGRAMC